MSYPPPQQYAPPPQQYAPPPSYTPQDPSLQAPLKAGDSPLLSMFTEGNVIILRSNSCGKSLRIRQGEVEGIGGQGPHAKFTVHVRRPAVVALQNVHNPDWWLAVYEGKTIGSGRGGPYCEFYVGQIEEKYIVLESVMYPGQHVGFLPDGVVKGPKETHTGLHARFVPVVLEVAQPPPQSLPPQPQYPPAQPQYPPAQPQYPPAQSQYPPAQPQYPPAQPQYPPAQPQYPPAQPQYPPAQGYPSTTYPQPGYATAPPPAGYPPPQPQPPMQQPAPPTGPQMPVGYKVLDAFQNGNIMQLIARSNGYPLQIKNATLYGNGTFTHTDSQFVVVTPKGGVPGVVMLQNVNWFGLYIAVRGGKVHGNGKGGKHCHFRVHALPDNYVYFESMEHPGEYVAMTSSGSAGNPKTVGPGDKEAQFFVRVERQKHNYSDTIMTAFGRPSIANQIRDHSIIQLYVKATNTYLSINNTGYVISTANGGDKHTFLEYIDRGMGIVSLHSFLYPGFRLRMSNYVLEGKGDPNMTADFRLQESQDGSVSFESVTCPGSRVGIQAKGTLHTNLHVFLVNIQKFGGSETITNLGEKSAVRQNLEEKPGYVAGEYRWHGSAFESFVLPTLLEDN